MESKELTKLVIFYSLDGNTKFIAESIKYVIGADLAELRIKKDIKPKGFIKYVWYGSQVAMNKKPELLALSKNPHDYDVIFIGTPIWARRHTPAINSFLDKVKIKGKKIALFCCHGGTGNGKSFSMISEQLKGNEIIGSIEFKEPLKNGKNEAIRKLKQWVEKIL